MSSEKMILNFKRGCEKLLFKNQDCIAAMLNIIDGRKLKGQY
jgi:hypothetical protein